MTHHSFENSSVSVSQNHHILSPSHLLIMPSLYQLSKSENSSPLSTAMRTHQQHPKLKNTPRPLFSCGFFCHCNNNTTLSPTSTPHSRILPPPPPPPPPPQQQHPSSSSSSSSTSQSFTQWKFPLNSPNSSAKPTKQQHQPPTNPSPISFTNLEELYHLAQLQLTSNNPLSALHLLERSLVPNPPLNSHPPHDLMTNILKNLKNNKPCAKLAAKILLALSLADTSRRVAVEVGAVGAVVEAVAELEDAAAERALAALELMCTVPEGAKELRMHALAVPMMVNMMGRLVGRGREYAMSVLGVVYACGLAELESVTAPPEEVARAVELALQGECTDRGKRKAAGLLKVLRNHANERVEFNHEEGG